MAVKNISGQSPASGRISDSIGANKTSKAGDVAGVVQGKVGTQPPLAKGVDVAVSDNAKTRAAERKLAKDLAIAAPEVREDRVASIKAKIADGSYKVDSDKIANGMMREAVMEHLTSDENR